MIIWSEKRKQLSLIIAESHNIHIQSQDSDSKEKSISIAQDVLTKFEIL